MKKIRFSVFYLTGVLILAGCGERERDKNYYKVNIQEADTVAKKCLSSNMDGINCTAAINAIGEANLGLYLNGAQKSKYSTEEQKIILATAKLIKENKK